MCCIIISRHVIFDEFRFPFANSSPTLDRSNLDFLVDKTVDTIPCATNIAASPPPAPPIQPAPAVAPSRADVEQPLPPSAGPGGCASMPLSGPPPPRQDAPRDVAELVPALPRFYTRRPDAAAPTSVATSMVEMFTSGPVPAAAPASSQPVTRAQSGTIQCVQYKGLITATVLSPIPTNYRSGLADPNWRATTVRSTRPSSTTAPVASFHDRSSPVS
jgi:hypothetical protein